ncbi:MAG: hypothetical protein EBQ84_10710 [Betaproteobacteria bacterium]|nr:hypothetical protein [Betaproteobacteria bacterium]
MIQADKILQFNPGDIAVNYKYNDCIFYALSVGVGMDATDTLQLPFVYEKNLSVMPMMASILGWGADLPIQLTALTTAWSLPVIWMLNCTDLCAPKIS